ncbi:MULTISPECIES: preprotein translocase subunit SecG [Lichenihabitans]|uniref:preprotein translocase subunit SecG n=1 Tax=Lichenihabitans TaxID=2723776 RepID=UPI0010359D0D|nr:MULTISPECIES: preprotein translocase subunit SecG [Lichenihabitans]UDL95379.1 preprotein translocase subunit SecG [Lichenihabitans sp. PAMC28606]
MQTVLIVFHLMIVVALVASVLLQRSEGGALGVGGGGGFMTGRGQANALTRATAILAGLFFVTSLSLSIIASYNRAPKSILDTAVPAGVTTTAPVQGGTPLDQLKRLEQQRNSTAPAAPTAPAVPATPEAPKSQ